MTSRHLPALLALVAAFTVSVSTSVAFASPGTCKCNSGCHANAGQCLRPSSCSLGYAPTCGYRDGSGGATCPKVGYISCNGDCTCVPIPGFCESIGGAEYCDAGAPDTGPPQVVDARPPSDVGVGDALVTDGSVRDSGPVVDLGVGADAGAVADGGHVMEVGEDGGVTPGADAGLGLDDARADAVSPQDGGTALEDGALTSDVSVLPEPDAAVSQDGATEPGPEDVGPAEPDVLVTDGASSSCIPAACPSGTRAFGLPGECDPFCAQPCSKGEFRCDLGFTCLESYCVPNCVATGCSTCMSCSLGGGECFDLGQCVATDAGSGGGLPRADVGGSVTDGAVASTDGGGGVGVIGGGLGGGRGDAALGYARVDFPLDGATDGLPSTGDGGCNCRVPSSSGGSSGGSNALGLGLVGLVIGLLRRRRARPTTKA